MIAVAPTPESTRNPLELAVHSCARLIKERAHERDVARLERDLARRERDTAKEMLSVTLGLLHEAEKQKRRLQQQLRARFGLDADQQQQNDSPERRAA